MGQKPRAKPNGQSTRTRIADPFYRDILAALQGDLDDQLFEQCACALLQDVYPGITPISGGSDGGMDGAIPDPIEGEPYALICTTARASNKVVANLRRSVQSFIKRGGKSRRVVLATPRRLTPATREKLRDAARLLGFTLANSHAQDWFAPALYDAPFWTSELLKLDGAPTVLSAIPRGQRGDGHGPLIGRDEVLRRVEESKGDMIIIGQPGSGKTRVLAELVRSGALFVNGADVVKIARELRKNKPTALLVDDSLISQDLTREFLEQLQQLRRDGHAKFRILASSWPGARSELMHALDVDSERVLELRPLTRDQIVELAVAAGIPGPRELLRLLADQAEGRPGLLTTLARQVTNGRLQEVVTGAALAEALLPRLKRIVGRDDTVVLGVFAIGGESGFSTTEAGRLLGLPAAEVQDRLRGLAAAGIIREIGVGNERRIVVTPRPLQWILVRDTFFVGPCALSLEETVASAPDRAHATVAICGAVARGARMDGLFDLVQHANSRLAWQAYASIGRSNLQNILRDRPDVLEDVLDSALLYAPRESLGYVLRAINSTTGWRRNQSHTTLRRVVEWMELPASRGQRPIERRKALLDAALAEIRAHGPRLVTSGACLVALSPSVRDTATDPGGGRTLTFTHGILGDVDLEAVSMLWPHVFAALEWTGSELEWDDVFDLLQSWRAPIGVRAESAESHATRKGFVARAIRDIASVDGLRSSTCQRINMIARLEGLALPLQIDSDFADLFPNYHPHEGWAEFEAGNTDRVVRFVERYRDREPALIARRLVELDTEAASVKGRWHRLVPSAAAGFAGETNQLLEWVDALRQCDAAADLIAPFLEKLARTCLTSTTFSH